MAAYGYRISAKTAEDYMLGGRTIGVVVMFFFVLFAISSAWTFYGFPGCSTPGARLRHVHLG
jgi:solute:Na+ symporter, SSS family